MSKLPPVHSATYNKIKNGYYGELGEGANAKICFIQTAINRTELDSITLIENIPGSESWDVRDLFQRDVDKKRVTDRILPYLKDLTKVKFFNPLTLMVLPLDDSGTRVEQSVIYVEPREETEEGHQYRILERPNYYQFRVHVEKSAFSEVRWNDQNSADRRDRWTTPPVSTQAMAQAGG